MPFSIYHSQGPTYHGKLDAQGKTSCYKQLPDGHATVEVGQPRDLDQKIQSQRQQLKKVLHQIIQKTRQHYDQHDHDSTLLHRLGQYAQGFKQGVEDLAVSTWHATETVGHVFQNTAVTDFQIAQWLATGDEAVQHKLAQKGETITHTLQHLSGDAQQGYHLLKLLMTDHDTRQLLIQFLKQYWAALPEDQQMQDIGEVVGNLGGVGILLGILGKVARFTPKALPTSAHSAMNQAAQKANKLAELLKQRQQAKKLNKAELNKKQHLVEKNKNGRQTSKVMSDKELIGKAQSIQTESGYNKDNYKVLELKEGDELIGGLPGQSAFYTDRESLNQANLSRSKLFQGLQVEPHPILGYRPKVGVYKVKKNIRIPYGKVQANPEIGQGGLNQYVNFDYENSLELIEEIELEE